VHTCPDGRFERNTMRRSTFLHSDGADDEGALSTRERGRQTVRPLEVARSDGDAEPDEVLQRVW